MAASAIGSSPLARGLRIFISKSSLGMGIIPARAGFTNDCTSPASTCQDHPRSRGVYKHASSEGYQTTGSSPLARGLRCIRINRACPTGIIPARAGFTYIDKWGEVKAKDHPRSRGVYAPLSFVDRLALGSSPLARGLHDFYCVQRGLGGIIPARAGFTPSRTGSACPGTDHPRSRGVYCGYQYGTDIDSGSSPLARGLRVNIERQARKIRIIPARAGFTISAVDPVAVLRDHPRSRGVYESVSA